MGRHQATIYNQLGTVVLKTVVALRVAPPSSPQHGEWKGSFRAGREYASLVHADLLRLRLDDGREGLILVTSVLNVEGERAEYAFQGAGVLEVPKGE